MTIAFYCVLIAAFLPILFTAIAKFTGPGFNNNSVRNFQEKLDGMRQRAHWAHLNSFEAFPPFAAAVVIAHLVHGANPTVNMLALAFVGLRLVYGALYIADLATMRSLVWLGAVGTWVAMYFV
jgi:uncharacterized MAPEG superfamily protein